MRVEGGERKKRGGEEEEGGRGRRGGGRGAVFPIHVPVDYYMYGHIPTD